jgi:hypothetical protein
VQRTKTKPKFGRNEIVVCWQTIGVDESISPEGVIKKGTRLKAGHRWVREFPHMFIPEDTPDDEWPSPFADLRLAPVKHENADITIAEKLPADQLIRCTHSIGGLGGTLLFQKGREYKRDAVPADLIERFPECWEEVTEDGK